MEELEKSIDRIHELESELTKNEKPLILVEGISDELILNTAWSALNPEKEIPFSIRASDSLANQPELSSGGVHALAKAIESIHPADGRQVIAIFDHDSDGYSAFSKLSKNFKVPENNVFYKKHKNNYASAITLAIGNQENQYALNKNLCIEFLFDEKYLGLKNSKGHGLTISQASAKISVGKKHQEIPAKEIHYIEDMFGDLKYFRRIIDGKKVFSEEIVPSLGKEAFSNFHPIFCFIDRIIKNQVS